MKGLHGFGIARVREVSLIGDGNARHLSVKVEFEERTLTNGKRFAQRLEFRTFHPDDINRAHELRPGAWVTFDGYTDAEPIEHGGKLYANPRVNGRIQAIHQAAA